MSSPHVVHGVHCQENGMFLCSGWSCVGEQEDVGVLAELHMECELDGLELGI